MALAERVLVMSHTGAAVIRLDADPGHADRVAVVPWAVPTALAEDAPRAVPPGGPLIATFGIVNEVKQIAKVIEAFTMVLEDRPDARMAVVGPASDDDVRKITDLVQRLDVAAQVEVTNEVEEEAYLEWLGRATVAVQLRAVSNGESSAAVGDCLVFGIPTIVTAIGPARELPDAAVAKVAPSVSPRELAGEILALLADEQRRVSMSGAAAAFVAGATFDGLAAELCRQVLGTS